MFKVFTDSWNQLNSSWNFCFLVQMRCRSLWLDFTLLFDGHLKLHVKFLPYLVKDPDEIFEKTALYAFYNSLGSA